MPVSWWHTAVIYQIYPRSFQDSNGDGVGDLRGIERRLDHFIELGADAIWLSPIFTSPMADFGYDIADYKSVDPLFGTLEDFDSLLASAHRRGIKLILDLVPNHTSDKHPWFIESRSAKQNPRRQWYLWRSPGPGSLPPNNWISEFGGSAWEYDQRTSEYYYHAFLPQQPDLNWRNPDVRAAIYDVMRFWLGRGVDGFRIDVIWHLIKDHLFRDNPANPEYRPGDPEHRQFLPLYTTDRPEIHDVIAEMRAVTEEFSDRVLIGEIYLPIERLIAYYGQDLRGLHLPFNFTLLNASWSANSLANLIAEYEQSLPSGGWPNWVLGNHDKPRIASRIGAAQARIAAMLLLTLRGTPTIYYGEEIGMEQVSIPPERVRDPAELRQPGKGMGRDGCRTPMPWDSSERAGFSIVDPWLPLAPDHRMCCVSVQRDEVDSMYSLYRDLLALRKKHLSLSIGSFRPFPSEGNLLLFGRQYNSDRLLIALNLGPDAAVTASKYRGRLLFSSHRDRQGQTVCGEINLRPNEGAIVELF